MVKETDDGKNKTGKKNIEKLVTVLPVLVDNIPEELKKIPQWVNWISVQKDKKNKPTKIPIDAKKLKEKKNTASCTDKNTWSDFKTASANLNKKNSGQSIAGIGFCLTDNDDISIIDIDHCIDPITNAVHPIALFWVELFDSYTEISPSGTGLHIFITTDESIIGTGKNLGVKGTISKVGFEAYETKRYFTLTGQPLSKDYLYCGDLSHRPDVLNFFMSVYFSKRRGSTGWCASDGAIPESNRSTTLISLAGSFASNLVNYIDVDYKGLPVEGYTGVIGTLINYFNNEYCKSPLPSKEIKGIQGQWETYLKTALEDELDYLNEGEGIQGYQVDSVVDSGIELPEVDPDSIVTYSPNELLNCFIFLRNDNCFYNKKSRSIIPRASVNMSQRGLTLKVKINGKKRVVDLVTYLQISKQAIQCDALTWHPGKPEFFTQSGFGYVNSYVPIDYTSLPKKYKPKQIDIYQKLIAHIIPEQNLQDAYLDYLAYTLQYPGRKINYGVLLVSRCEGIGKDLLLEPLSRIMGDQCNYVSNDMLFSDFNQFLDRTKLMIVSEVYQSSQKRKTLMSDKLRTILASPPTTFNINIKGEKLRHIPNLCSTVMMSNHIDPISIEDPDMARRYLAIKSDSGRLPTEFYNQYGQWLDNNNYYHIIRFLLERDLSKFNPSTAPYITDYIRELSDLSSSPIHDIIKQEHEQASGCFKNDLFSVDQVIGMLDSSWKLPPRTVIYSLKKLGYRYFGSGKDRKTYRKEGIGKLLSCCLFIHESNPLFKKYWALTGTELTDIFHKQPD